MTRPNTYRKPRIGSGWITGYRGKHVASLNSMRTMPRRGCLPKKHTPVDKMKKTPPWPPHYTPQMAAVSYCDGIYVDMHCDEREVWHNAVKAPGMSGYDLWMKESLYAVTRGFRPPQTPTPSGGFSVPYILNVHKERALAICCANICSYVHVDLINDIDAETMEIRLCVSQPYQVKYWPDTDIALCFIANGPHYSYTPPVVLNAFVSWNAVYHLVVPKTNTYYASVRRLHHPPLAESDYKGFNLTGLPPA